MAVKFQPALGSSQATDCLWVMPHTVLAATVCQSMSGMSTINLLQSFSAGLSKNTDNLPSKVLKAQVNITLAETSSQKDPL